MAHIESTRRRSLRLGARGRVVLPADLRRRLRLRTGDRLTVTEGPDGRLVLAPLAAQVRRLAGVLRDLAPKRSLADDLIRERRREARGERGA